MTFVTEYMFAWHCIIIPTSAEAYGRDASSEVPLVLPHTTRPNLNSHTMNDKQHYDIRSQKNFSGCRGNIHCSYAQVTEQ